MIFDSRLAFHFIPNSFKVFLIIDPTVSAKRVLEAERGNVERYSTVEEAIAGLKARTQSETNRFYQMYGVDISDLNNYDLVVDTTYSTPEEIADTIQKYAKSYKESSIQNWDSSVSSTVILVSPKTLYPTNKVQHLDMGVINRYKEELAKQKNLEPLLIKRLDGHNYILDGHHRWVAYLMNEDTSLIECHLNQLPTVRLSDTSVLEEELKYISKSSLYDYEDIGRFHYISYPDKYEQ